MKKFIIPGSNTYVLEARTHALRRVGLQKVTIQYKLDMLQEAIKSAKDSNSLRAAILLQVKQDQADTLKAFERELEIILLD